MLLTFVEKLAKGECKRLTYSYGKISFCKGCSGQGIEQTAFEAL